MKSQKCILMLLLVALDAAAFEVPPVKQWPKEKIPPAHAGRILNWEGIDNVRDFGGVKTRDGRMVKRGLVYRSQAFNFNAVCSWMTAKRMESKLRGGQFRYDFGEACMKTMLDRIGTNDLSKSCAAIAAEVAAGTNAWKRRPSRLTPESRAKILRETGLRTEIDLRSTPETWGMDASPLGPTVAWHNIPGVSLGELTSGSGRLMFKKCFRIFLDEKNYPIDFHCIAGADRTGALAAALYGLLGVPEDVIRVDYTLTSFSTSGIRTAKAFDHMAKKAFKSKPGTSFNEKIEAFALECGFTQSDIERFREIMLEKGE